MSHSATAQVRTEDVHGDSVRAGTIDLKVTQQLYTLSSIFWRGLQHGGSPGFPSFVVDSTHSCGEAIPEAGRTTRLVYEGQATQSWSGPGATRAPVRAAGSSIFLVVLALIGEFQARAVCCEGCGVLLVWRHVQRHSGTAAAATLGQNRSVIPLEMLTLATSTDRGEKHCAALSRLSRWRTEWLAD